jgi:hypothetical protein
LHIYHYSQNLSSDHLLSGVIAEYYRMNSGSSGREPEKEMRKKFCEKPSSFHVKKAALGCPAEQRSAM